MSAKRRESGRERRGWSCVDWATSAFNRDVILAYCDGDILYTEDMLAALRRLV